MQGKTRILKVVHMRTVYSVLCVIGIKAFFCLQITGTEVQRYYCKVMPTFTILNVSNNIERDDNVD